MYDMLTEEECYLWAIISDPSGLDTGEFLITDEENSKVKPEEGRDGSYCFRAWPFQWPWWRDNSKQTIEQGARSIGKSMSIRFRCLAFPIVHPGGEMVLTAPEGVHLDAITDVVETMFLNNRFTRELLVGGRQGFRHRPFHANFKNGARIMGRIPQRDGRGVKGCFEAGTLVLTRRGAIPIEQVEVGDVVFTHKGNWKPVTHTWIFHEQNPVRVKATRLAEGIVCSGIEPFWARYGNPLNMVRNEPEWCLAKDIGSRHDRRRRWNLLSPAAFPEEDQPEFPFRYNDDLETLYWIFGVYQAEGSTSEKAGQVTLSIHESEVDQVREAVEALGHNAGVSLPKGQNGKGRDIYFSSQPFIKFLREHFGRGKSKRIPSWMYGAPEKLRMRFLEGALYGDGYEVHPGAYEYVTVIRSLAYEMKMLGQTLGYTAAVHRNNTATSYSDRGWYRVALTYQPDSSSFIEDTIMAGVQSVTSLEPMTVYDLTVDEDHSFTANSVFARNTHPVWLELDEGQDYPEAGWKEIIETVKEFDSDSQWRVHGVTRGVRDSFYKYTTEEHSDWNVHHLPAMYRPTFTDEERQKKIKLYGSVDSPDFRRNVYGLHGDAMSPLFVLHRLMKCRDDDVDSEYNATDYYSARIDEGAIRHNQDEIIPLIKPPATHFSKYMPPTEDGVKNGPFWVGMDIGLTVDPTVIVIFAEEQRKGKPSQLRLISKLTLVRVGTPELLEAVLHLTGLYKPYAFTFDSTGVGLPILQMAQHVARSGGDFSLEARKFLRAIKGYNFSEKIVVEYDDTVEVDPYDPDGLDKAAIKRVVKDYATDILRMLVDDRRLILPFDKDVLAEFQNQSESYSKDGVDQYGRKKTYCVDEETEILTDSGWKTFDQVTTQDRSWSYDLETGQARWSDIEAVNVFEGQFEVVRMQSDTHDSLTTPNHRWPVQRLRNDRSGSEFWWADLGFFETDSLPSTSRHRILCAAPPENHSPKKHPDELVRIIAWYLSEGNEFNKGDGLAPQVTISQSWKKNRLNCRDIETDLTNWGCRWSKTEGRDGKTSFRILKGEHQDLLLSYVDQSKRISPRFLTELTDEQLWEFLDVMIRSDGWCGYCKSGFSWDRPAQVDCLSVGFAQKRKHVTDLFSMACAMVGLATSDYEYETKTKNGTYTMYGCHVRQNVGFLPRSTQRSEEVVSTVWCPTTTTGTWLARRRGKTYFTGNSSGYFHTLDASRMAVLGWKQHVIEAYQEEQSNTKYNPPPRFFGR